MTSPVQFVVDDDAGSLGTLDGTLRRRYERDYLVIAESSPEAALGGVRGVRRPVHAAARTRSSRRAGWQQLADSQLPGLPARHQPAGGLLQLPPGTGVNAAPHLVGYFNYP